jgi:hypothetical protein
VPLIQLAMQRLRWQYGTPTGRTDYRAAAVLRYAGLRCWRR